MTPKIPLTRQDISDVVGAFYARVRAHNILGPVFAAHVTDWPAHEEKITCFWVNAILQDKSYSGNPMQVHMRAGNVEIDHFAMWLHLFDETLNEHLASPLGDQWSQLAHRIGRGLSLGIDDARRSHQVVPNLLDRN